MKIWNSIANFFFPKTYYLAWTRPTISGPLRNPKTTYSVTALYRKKNKQGKTRFYIDHNLSSRCLMHYWEAKWWMLVIQVAGSKRNKLFAYESPNGHVFLKKVKV